MGLFVLFIAPQGILEEEDEQHDDGRDNGSPSGENVGAGQVSSNLKKAAFLGLGVDGLGEPEEGRNASAGAAVLGLEQAHHLHVGVHGLGNVLVGSSADSVVPALSPRGEAVGRDGGDGELSLGAGNGSTSVVIQVGLISATVALGVGVSIARALRGAHPAVDLVQHVGVEVRTLHERLGLSGVLL